LRNESHRWVEIGDGLAKRWARCATRWTMPPQTVKKRSVIRAGRLVLQRLDFAGPVPKLYVVVVNELLSGLLRGVIIRAVEINCLHNACGRGRAFGFPSASSFPMF
jgi:hypothetical protein